MTKLNETRGKPKSGRTWRDVRTASHGSIKQGKRISFAKRIQFKQEDDRVKAIDAKLKQERAQRKESKRLKEEEKRQRKAENERKSEIVVPLKNPAKIKKMKKSQLRSIAKR